MLAKLRQCILYFQILFALPLLGYPSCRKVTYSEIDAGIFRRARMPLFTNASIFDIHSRIRYREYYTRLADASFGLRLHGGVDARLRGK